MITETFIRRLVEQYLRWHEARWRGKSQARNLGRDLVYWVADGEGETLLDGDYIAFLQMIVYILSNEKLMTQLGFNSAYPLQINDVDQEIFNKAIQIAKMSHRNP